MDEQELRRQAERVNKLFEDAAEKRYGRRHRDPGRIDRIIEQVRERWHQRPTERLFQLLINAWGDQENLYNVEDDDLEVKLTSAKETDADESV